MRLVVVDDSRLHFMSPCLPTSKILTPNRFFLQAEVEETLKRLQAHKGVQGVVIVNNDGIPIRSTLTDQALTTQYAALLTQLASKARNAVRELDPAVRLYCVVVLFMCFAGVCIKLV